MYVACSVNRENVSEKYQCLCLVINTYIMHPHLSIEKSRSKYINHSVNSIKKVVDLEGFTYPRSPKSLPRRIRSGSRLTSFRTAMRDLIPVNLGINISPARCVAVFNEHKAFKIPFGHLNKLHLHGFGPHQGWRLHR
jgi:hypothetical protein